MIQQESDTISPFVGPLPDFELMAEEAPVVSLFEGHSLVGQNDLLFIDKLEIGNEIGFLIFLICSVLLIYIHRNAEGFLASVFRASFDRNLAGQDARVENTQRSRSLLLVQLVSILSISLFGSTVFLTYGSLKMDPIIAFLWAVALLLNLSVVKKLMQWLLAQVFNLQGEMRYHRFSGNVLLSAVGLVLLPVSVLLIYSPQIPALAVTTLGLTVIGFFYIKGLLRGFQLAVFDNAISPLYLFYYFCALELLPVFVLIRVAISL
ncbi:MAG: DUF4271 domain-containing protein [Flavobacteriales bacterium]